MAVLSRFSRVVNWILLVIGGVALVAMMGIVVGNALGRAIFKTPIFGTIEDAGLAGAVLVAVAIGFVERERVNIVIRALFDHFPQRVQYALQILTLFLSLGATGYLFWSILGKGLDSVSEGETTIVTQTPVAPFRFAWAVGVLILTIYLAQHLVQHILKGEKK